MQMDYPFQRPLVIAHRGARSLAPENTLLAARKGFELGADLWELDVAMTRDDEIVVIHDDTLTRTSNAKEIYPHGEPWGVHLFTLDELKQLDFSCKFIQDDPFKQIAAGAIPEMDLLQMRRLQIPTLREALLLTRALNWRVNIEIKDLSGLPGDAGIVEEVVSLVEAVGMVNQVIISSFNHDYLLRAKQSNPHLTTAALVETPVSDPIALLQRLDAQAYNPGIRELTNFDQIRDVRKAGFDVYIWTVNDEATLRKLITAGVSGIFTDFPQMMVKLLRENQN